MSNRDALHADDPAFEQLLRADRLWRMDGWFPALAIFLVAIVGIALEGAIGAGSELGVRSDDIVNQVTQTLTAYGTGAIDTLADLGEFITPSAPWLIETLIALVLAVVAVPALRDLSTRQVRDSDSNLEQIAFRAIALETDEAAAALRKELPGISTDLALRRFAGIAGQLVAAATALMWSVVLISVLRQAIEDARSISAVAIGAIFIAPFVVALAVVAGLYRVDPTHTRMRTLVAQLLNERATRAIASTHNPGYPASWASLWLWSYRIGTPVALASVVILILVIPALADGVDVINSAGSLHGLALGITLLFAVAYLLLEVCATALVWSRFWLGRPASLVLLPLFTIALVVVIVSFFVTVTFPQFVGGFWGLAAVFTLLTLMPTLGMALPAIVPWRGWLAFVPGFAHLPRIERAREKLIDDLTKEIQMRLPALVSESRITFWHRVGRIFVCRSSDQGGK